jgi:DNA-binding NarL/FixJ family response regulator
MTLPTHPLSVLGLEVTRVTVLMDLEMRDVSGIDAITAIQAEFPQIRMLTSHGSDVQMLRPLNTGAVGYLLKDGPGKELRDAMRRIYTEHCVVPTVAQRLLEPKVDTLSERESEVLMSVAAGNSNKIVADKLSISEETVKTHMRSILSKLGANDRTHAVTIAVKRGVIRL